MVKDEIFQIEMGHANTRPRSSDSGPESPEVMEAMTSDYPDISGRYPSQMLNVDSSNLSSYIKINRANESNILGPRQRAVYRRIKSFEEDITDENIDNDGDDRKVSSGSIKRGIGKFTFKVHEINLRKDSFYNFS